jgi:hypothetical protein
MAKYKSDPRWIKLKFDGSCARCKSVIRRGERAFYFHRIARSIASKRVEGRLRAAISVVAFSTKSTAARCSTRRDAKTIRRKTNKQVLRVQAAPRTRSRHGGTVECR